MTAIVIILTLPLLNAGSSQRAHSISPAPQERLAGHGRDLSTEVRTVLSVKCAECHGGNLSRPKGRFGHVEDLKRVAGDPQLVVPFRPGESKLWQLVRDNEMPP